MRVLDCRILLVKAFATTPANPVSSPRVNVQHPRLRTALLADRL